MESSFLSIHSSNLIINKVESNNLKQYRTTLQESFLLIRCSKINVKPALNTNKRRLMLKSGFLIDCNHFDSTNKRKTR